MSGREASIQARAVGEGVRPPPLVEDPAVLEAYAEDASGRPRGRARGLLRPGSEEEAAAYLRATAGTGAAVLPQAARTSLTGGAIPHGEVVLSVEGLRDIGAVRPHGTSARVEAGAGVRLRDLQESLAGRGFYYPPIPTYQEAMLGGAVSTNAGGAATFKYGATRSWVRGLRVLLFNGDLLEIERGQVQARPGEAFRIGLSDGSVREVPVPTYRLPGLKKISAGYYAADPLDLLDLFVGSEGTLGLITRVTLDLVPLPPSVMTGLVFVEAEDQGLALAAELGDTARGARERGDPRGPDIRAIEWMDSRSVALLRATGDLDRHRVRAPEGRVAGVLFELELPERATNEQAHDLLAAWLDGPRAAPDVPMVRLFEVLGRHVDLDSLVLAFPEDEGRRQALRALREAVPSRVNEILAERRRADPAVRKVGGDLIVPVERLPEMVCACEEAFARRGLGFALWGHVSDGNLHPNGLPRNEPEVEVGEEALLELGELAARLGGCPLSEHGVGRSPVKQEMLRRFLGEAAIAEMWAIKSALDPEGRFAPGVLLPRLED